MLAVTAAGLVTSLGDLVSTCAALRAGMTRAEALDLALPNPGEEDPAQVRGHCVPDVAGAEDYGRLLALLALALEGALGDRRAMLAEDATQVVIILPPEDDRGALTGLDLEEEFPPDGPERFIAEQLPVLLDVDFPPKKVTFVRGGHTAAAQALAQARAPLERREAKRVVIAAADSLVEEANVLALIGQARLRTDTMADGFHPGEAGAAVVLEDVPRDRLKDTAPLLLIGPIVFRAGPPPPLEPEEDEDGDGEDG
jgi:3-oxoacyl-[acyl-carrier-protein] synthase I